MRTMKLRQFVELFGRFPEQGEMEAIANGGWKAPEAPEKFTGSEHPNLDWVKEPKAEAKAEPPYPPTIPGSQAATDWREARPSFDNTFIEIAKIVAKRGTCPRLQVGAVITVDNRIIATGYNGSPAGLPHCSEVGCLIPTCQACQGGFLYGSGNICQACKGSGKAGGCKRTTHAEANALIQCARQGSSPVGGTIYVTHRPCVACAGLIITAGIRRVVWVAPYNSDGLDNEVFKMFAAANMEGLIVGDNSP